MSFTQDKVEDRFMICSFYILWQQWLFIISSIIIISIQGCICGKTQWGINLKFEEKIDFPLTIKVEQSPVPHKNHLVSTEFYSMCFAQHITEWNELLEKFYF